LCSFIFANRQESKVAKDIEKIAKNSWRHKKNLGALRGLGGSNM
jgi:hypothetical protein